MIDRIVRAKPSCNNYLWMLYSSNLNEKIFCVLVFLQLCAMMVMTSMYNSAHINEEVAVVAASCYFWVMASVSSKIFFLDSIIKLLCRGRGLLFWAGYQLSGTCTTWYLLLVGATQSR